MARSRLLGSAIAVLVVVALCVALWHGQLVARSFYLLAVWTPAMVLRTPRRIVVALEASGPVFIKLGQWLSTRRDILPEELCDEMGRLHETVDVAPVRRDRLRILEALPDVHIGDILGGGCIAQVYAGELEEEPGGNLTPVAIKVRRGEVKRLLHLDVILLHHAARVAEYFRPDLKWLAMDKSVDNFGWYMQQQANLSIEAEHLQHFADDFRDGRVEDGTVRVPRVIKATDTILVTTIAQGRSLSAFIREKHPGPVRKAVFHATIDMMARMILKTNFIHGDLHPGNLFVFVPPDNKPEITLIDAGIAIEMSQSLTDMARASAIAAFRKQPLALGKALIGLHKDEGLCDYAEDVEGLERKVGYLLYAGCFMCSKEIWSEMFATYEEYRGSRVSEYFTRMIAELSTHKVRISPSLWSMVTAFALIEGSCQELGHGVNVLRAATPYIVSSWDVPGKLKNLFTAKRSEQEHRKR